jgi:hypothetical protein
VIVDTIYKTKECRKRITAEEMSAVLEERDAALSQVTASTREVHRAYFLLCFKTPKQ